MGENDASQLLTRTSVVIPAHNEEQNIGPVLAAMPAGLHEIILVDGHSSDQTITQAQAAYPSIRIIHQEQKGKGDALRLGFAACSGEYIVMLDADGSLNPQELPAFVAALAAGGDCAKGSRYLPQGGSADITPIRSLGNLFLTKVANILFRRHFTDLCYGYIAFRADCLPRLDLDCAGFEIESQIILEVCRARLRIVEVPSFEHPRFSGESHLDPIPDGLHILGMILRERFKPLAKRIVSLRPALSEEGHPS